MLGQSAIGWIDRRCRQVTGLKEEIFGGKSVILIGGPGQLPPVADKPLYQAKPSSDICQQGYMAYLMFNNVVLLTVNQRVSGIHSEPFEIVWPGCEMVSQMWVFRKRRPMK